MIARLGIILGTCIVQLPFPQHCLAAGQGYLVAHHQKIIESHHHNPFREFANPSEELEKALYSHSFRPEESNKSGTHLMEFFGFSKGDTWEGHAFQDRTAIDDINALEDTYEEIMRNQVRHVPLRTKDLESGFE